MKPYYRILRLNHGRAPTVQHATLKEAETEALRLAGQHPGDTFEILQCLGIARTTEPSIFWTDTVENPDGGTPGIDPGEGYELVPVGYVLDGTEGCWEGGAWIPRSFGRGIAVRPTDAPTRRKLPEVDPGEGYRYYRRASNLDRPPSQAFIWRTSDKGVTECRYLNEPSDVWERVSSTIGGTTTGFVEVREDGSPIVVDPGEGYRLLEEGEQIAEGDEESDDEYGGGWSEVTFSATTDHYRRVNFFPVRRKLPEAVKDQPEYRFLQPGERIEEGDEYLVYGSDPEEWRPRQTSLGSLWYPQTLSPTRRPINNTPPR